MGTTISPSGEPFDQKCASELAILNRTLFAGEDKKNRAEAYQKVKLDRQIVAVLKVHGATAIYTDDKRLANRAQMCGISPIRIADLPEPEQDRQLNMQFDSLDPLPEVPNDEFSDIDPASLKEDQRDARPTST